jgi:hypothetical protein
MSKKRSKFKEGDVINTHVARFVGQDGKPFYAWTITHGLEQPRLDSHWTGPFKTKAEADDAAERAIQELLGPHCEVRDGGPFPSGGKH